MPYRCVKLPVMSLRVKIQHLACELHHEVLQRVSHTRNDHMIAAETYHRAFTGQHDKFSIFLCACCCVQVSAADDVLTLSINSDFETNHTIQATISVADPSQLQ